MAYGYRSGSFLDRIPPGTKWLMAANIVVYLLMIISHKLFPVYLGARSVDPISYFFALNLGDVLNNYYIWQIASYMFLHGGLWHLLINMMILWFTGTELENYWGTKRFVRYYLITGAGAGLFIFIIDLSAYLMHVNGVIQTVHLGSTLGASGAIFGLLLAYALYFPERQIMLLFPPIPIQAKWFVIIYAGIEIFFLLFGRYDGISHSGHVGGLVAGWIYFRANKRNMLYQAANNSMNAFLKGFKDLLFPSRTRVSRPSTKQGGNIFNLKRSADSLNDSQMSDEEIELKIDDLLAKISRKGLGGLSIEEKLFLDRVSRRYRHKFPD